MICNIVLPTEISYYDFDSFFQKLSMAVDEGHREISLDCYKVKFLDIYSIVGLLICINHLAQSKDVHFEWKIPKGNVRSFLGRINFLQSLSSHSTIWPEIDPGWIEQQSNLHGVSQMLLELIPIRNEENIQEILERTERTLRQELGYKKNDAFDVCIMLSELCHNIIEHNPDTVIGFVSMQYYRPLTRKPYLQVAVGDNGIGIPSSLRKNPRYTLLKIDRLAIERSMQQNVTEFADEFGRGQGLHQLQKLCAKHRGAITLCSGKGKIYEKYALPKRRGSFDVVQIPGTLIGMNFEAEVS